MAWLTYFILLFYPTLKECCVSTREGLLVVPIHERHRIYLIDGDWWYYFIIECTTGLVCKQQEAQELPATSSLISASTTKNYKTDSSSSNNYRPKEYPSSHIECSCRSSTQGQSRNHLAWKKKRNLNQEYGAAWKTVSRRTCSIGNWGKSKKRIGDIKEEVWSRWNQDPE